MNVRFLTIARQEVDDTYVWFENKCAGKGLEFLDELDRAVRLVTAYPHASPEIAPGTRRRIFARFPYALLYGVDNRLAVCVGDSDNYNRVVITGSIESGKTRGSGVRERFFATKNGSWCFSFESK